MYALIVYLEDGYTSFIMGLYNNIEAAEKEERMLKKVGYVKTRIQTI